MSDWGKRGRFIVGNEGVRADRFYIIVGTVALLLEKSCLCRSVLDWARNGCPVIRNEGGFADRF